MPPTAADTAADIAWNDAADYRLQGLAARADLNGMPIELLSDSWKPRKRRFAVRLSTGENILVRAKNISSCLGLVFMDAVMLGPKEVPLPSAVVYGLAETCGEEYFMAYKGGGTCEEHIRAWHAVIVEMSHFFATPPSDALGRLLTSRALQVAAEELCSAKRKDSNFAARVCDKATITGIVNLTGVLLATRLAAIMGLSALFNLIEHRSAASERGLAIELGVINLIGDCMRRHPSDDDVHEVAAELLSCLLYDNVDLSTSINALGSESSTQRVLDAGLLPAISQSLSARVQRTTEPRIYASATNFLRALFPLGWTTPISPTLRRCAIECNLMQQISRLISKHVHESTAQDYSERQRAWKRGAGPEPEREMGLRAWGDTLLNCMVAPMGHGLANQENAHASWAAEANDLGRQLLEQADAFCKEEMGPRSGINTRENRLKAAKKSIRDGMAKTGWSLEEMRARLEKSADLDSVTSNFSEAEADTLKALDLIEEEDRLAAQGDADR